MQHIHSYSTHFWLKWNSFVTHSCSLWHLLGFIGRRRTGSVIFWVRLEGLCKGPPSCLLVLWAELHWGEASICQIRNYRAHLSSTFYSCDMLIPSFILENDLVILASSITLFPEQLHREQWKICSLLLEGKSTMREGSTGCPCSRSQLLLKPCSLPPRRELDLIWPWLMPALWVCPLCLHFNNNFLRSVTDYNCKMAFLALSQICGSRGQHQNVLHNLDQIPFGCSYG